jgi:murein DD-endopeptidase MepM/ murein hydrolase activator NlpD
MAMTIQQAQMAAMQLRARKPELQNMAVGDLVAQIMASEGAGQPAAGVGGLANLFATPLSPASPAPMQPAMLEAPKPTSLMFPATNASKAPNPLSWMGANPSSGYGAKRPTGSHQGIDYPVPKGTPIGTPAPGVVEVAKSDATNGNYVVVRHPNGQSTSYSHLSALNVKPWQTVEKGDVLGASGNTGRVRGKNGGYHLHLGARDEKNNRIDPRGILKDPSVLGTAPARESAVAAGIDSAATPVAAPKNEPMAPPKGAPSRFRPQFEQKQAELQQLKASIPAGKEPSAEQASQLRNLSSIVSRLQGMVVAEESAVVDADRAALLERQAGRLGREEELIERTRKLAPGNALIAFGNALAGAKPGEKFASALARGLQAGSESYTGARDAREASLRGIEEKRDAFTLQKIDAIQKARDEAIRLADSGVQMTRDQLTLAGLEDADIVNLATQEDRISEVASRADTAKSTASEAKTKAEKAGAVIDSEIALRLAQKIYYEAGGGRSDGTGNMTQNQLLTKIGDLSKERRGLMIKLNSPTTVGNEKAAVKLAIKYIDDELAGLRGDRPAAPAAASAAPRVAPNGRTYIPDPKRPGKYLEVVK